MNALGPSTCSIFISFKNFSVGRGDQLLVADCRMELDDQLLLLLGEVASPYIRTEIVHPPQPA